MIDLDPAHLVFKVYVVHKFITVLHLLCLERRGVRRGRSGRKEKGGSDGGREGRREGRLGREGGWE